MKPIKPNLELLILANTCILGQNKVEKRAKHIRSEEGKLDQTWEACSQF